MRRLSRPVYLVCLLFLACSTPKPEPARPEAAPEAAPVPESALPERSEVSDALRSLNPDASVVIRVRGDRVRQGPVFGAITGLRDAIPEARQGLTIAQAACGFDPLQAIQEVVIGAKHEHAASQNEPLIASRSDTPVMAKKKSRMRRYEAVAVVSDSCIAT